jgi:hypothetical protein
VLTPANNTLKVEAYNMVELCLATGGIQHEFDQPTTAVQY